MQETVLCPRAWGREETLPNNWRRHLPGRAVQVEGTVRRRHQGLLPSGFFGTWQCR